MASMLPERPKGAHPSQVARATPEVGDPAPRRSADRTATADRMGGRPHAPAAPQTGQLAEGALVVVDGDPAVLVGAGVHVGVAVGVAGGVVVAVDVDVRVGVDIGVAGVVAPSVGRPVGVDVAVVEHCGNGVGCPVGVVAVGAGAGAVVLDGTGVRVGLGVLDDGDELGLPDPRGWTRRFVRADTSFDGVDEAALDAGRCGVTGRVARSIPVARGAGAPLAGLAGIGAFASICARPDDVGVCSGGVHGAGTARPSR